MLSSGPISVAVEFATGLGIDWAPNEDGSISVFHPKPEQTGGRAGFLEYDVDCPACGENWEGVLGPAEGKEAV